MVKKYVNDEHLQIAMTEYNKKNSEIGHIVQTEQGKTVGRVTRVYDNTTGDGEQVYAVVKDPSTPRDQVKEVTVLFRGSTGPDKVLSNPADVWNDWAENDARLALRTWAQDHPNFTKDQDHSTGQLKASSRALKEIMEKYPHAKINIYGHSLGSMDAQYAMANLSPEEIQRIQKAYIYNGPNIYGLLNHQQQATIDLIKGRIHNYADPKDFISMVGRDLSKGSIDSVGMVYYADTKKQGMTDQHMTYGYQLDKNGKIKTLSSASTTAVNVTLAQMEQYKKLKEHLSSSGYNKNEKLFLDSEQATIISSGLSRVAHEGTEELRKLKAAAKQKAEEIYKSRRKVPFGFILSPSELEAAYAEGGLTYATTVGAIDEMFEPVVAKASQIEADFTKLEKQIKSGIQAKLDRDRKLAGDFNQWTNMR